MNQAFHYVVAGCKPWNRKVFDELISGYPGEWVFADNPEGLKNDKLKHIQPRYVFFLHWSWKVPPEIIKNYECVCFHMTDVPYGRGGSPLQNLILQGHRQTRLTALRMVEEFDAGPTYLKEDLSLEGNAEEIYIRASCLSARMIRQIIEQQPTPLPQAGKPVLFERRKPEASRIPELNNLQALHDYIRMLDADGYPPAFLEYNGFRYEFTRAALYHGKIVADVSIVPLDGDKA
jgi:methionyl-tRNA formyltransferase